MILTQQKVMLVSNLKESLSIFLKRRLKNGYKGWLNTKTKNNVEEKHNLIFGNILSLNLKILMENKTTNFLKMIKSSPV